MNEPHNYSCEGLGGPAQLCAQPSLLSSLGKSVPPVRPVLTLHPMHAPSIVPHPSSLLTTDVLVQDLPRVVGHVTWGGRCRIGGEMGTWGAQGGGQDQQVSCTPEQPQILSRGKREEEGVDWRCPVMNGLPSPWGAAQ